MEQASGIRTVIYQNFSEAEISRITEILDKFQVNYKVSVPEESASLAGSLNPQDRDVFRKKAQRSGFKIIEIEIEKIEFQKIPSDFKERLHALGIYEEVDSPFTEEELTKYTSEEYHKESLKKPDPKARLNQAAAIGAVTLLTVLWLMKKGFLKF